jgi:hypothetical protein
MSLSSRAEEALRRYSDRPASTDRDKQIASSAYGLSVLLDMAHKFALPPDESLENVASYINGKPIHLPYPSISLEMERAEAQVVIVAVEIDDLIKVFAASYYDGAWDLKNFQLRVPSGDNTEWDEDRVVCEAGPLYQPQSEADKSLARQAAGILARFLNALASPATRTEQVQAGASFAVNNKRRRKGKLPLYELRRVVIDVEKEARAIKSGQRRHAPPREHDRRGFWRNVGERLVWVRPTRVGSAALGRIDKTYEVRA